jgi:hypothetical protein
MASDGRKVITASASGASGADVLAAHGLSRGQIVLQLGALSLECADVR